MKKSNRSSLDPKKDDEQKCITVQELETLKNIRNISRSIYAIGFAYDPSSIFKDLS